MTNKRTVAEALEEYASRPLGNVKVLLVEDDPFLTEVVVTQLSKHGCVPYTADRGDEAIDLVEQFKPHVIILDLMLPVLSGEEVMAKLKQHPAHKDIPIVAFSNRSEKSDIDRVMKLGAAAYFVKAATQLGELADIVKQLAKKAS